MRYFSSFFKAQSLKPIPKQKDLLYYSKIRIYQDKSFFQLLNQYLIASLCKSEFFVSNSLFFVKTMQTCLGIFLNITHILNKFV